MYFLLPTTASNLYQLSETHNENKSNSVLFCEAVEFISYISIRIFYALVKLHVRTHGVLFLPDSSDF